jgi:hypothetical protein
MHVLFALQPEATMAEVREQAAGAGAPPPPANGAGAAGRHPPPGAAGLAVAAGRAAAAAAAAGVTGAGQEASPAGAAPRPMFKARRTARPVASPADLAPDGHVPQDEEMEDQQQQHLVQGAGPSLAGVQVVRRASGGAQQAGGGRGSGPLGIPALPERRLSAPSARATQEEQPAPGVRRQSAPSAAAAAAMQEQPPARRQSASPAPAVQQQQRPAAVRVSNAANMPPLVHRASGAAAAGGGVKAFPSRGLGGNGTEVLLSAHLHRFWFIRQLLCVVGP